MKKEFYITSFSILTVVFPGPSYEPCFSNTSLGVFIERFCIFCIDSVRGKRTGKRTAASGIYCTVLQSVQSRPRIIFYLKESLM